jgi:DNA-binding HxlR family transcriptional regulator
MRWKELDQQPCPIARSLSILGDRWTLLILRDCFLGVRRFEAFQASLAISRTILRDRLNHLVDNGLLMRRAYQDNPERFEYLLTPSGKSLQGVMLMLADWGNQQAVGKGGPLVSHVHKACGHAFRPVLACSQCGEAVVGSDVTTLAPLKSYQSTTIGSQ